jgi:hypothetical protein
MPINEISDFILHNTTALTAREQERKEKSYWLESDVVRAAGVPERAGLCKNGRCRRHSVC